MSTSYYVKGIIPADDYYNKMLTIYKACNNAGIEPPKDVLKFFNYEEPNGVGVEVKIDSEEGEDGCTDFIDVDISKLPKDVKIVRFIVSY
jgi:hypothetical protein